MQNSDAPIRAAVVGHSNVGKTSLIRTLTRNARFGEVAASPGTTRVVEVETIEVAGTATLQLADTPGFEDSIGLLEVIESLPVSPQALGVERLQAFLQSAEARSAYQQEAKVVRQLLDCDLIFYVIDAREPLLGKYRDELSVLSLSARPVLPVLNFIAAPEQRQSDWRQLLAALNLHAVIGFDTVIYSVEAELSLYQTLLALMASRRLQIESLMVQCRETRQARLTAAAGVIASALVSAAATRLAAGASTQGEQASRIQDRLRSVEQRASRELLSIFDFSEKDYGSERLPVVDGIWTLDLFDAETLKQFGIEAGSAAAKGAALGMGVDLAVGGISLGAAAGLGALIGGGWQAGKKYGRSALDYLRGERYLCAEPVTLQLMCRRLIWLAQQLDCRGHAAQHPLQGASAAVQLPQLDRYLRMARNHPEWAAESAAGMSDARIAVVARLSATLCDAIGNLILIRQR